MLLEAEAPMKKPHTRSGRKYPRRKLWIERRDAAFARADVTCEVTGEDLQISYIDEQTRQTIWKWRRAAHHIVAERFVRRWFPGADVHHLLNLLVVTPGKHAQLTAAERKLFRADIVGYKQELNRLGIAPEIFDRALKALAESVK